MAQAASFLDRPEAAALGRIVAVDANAYLACPGPRVVDGVELLADLLHPDTPGALPEGAAAISGSRRRTNTPHSPHSAQ